MKNYLMKFSICLGLLLVLFAKPIKAQWSAPGGGVNNIAYAMCSDGTNLYVGINNNPFDNATNYLLKWNGTTWTNLGYVKGSICALAYMGGNIYVGGVFTTTGGGAAGGTGGAGYNNIGAWNVAAGTWSQLGTGANSFVSALTASGSTLYVGGDFTTCNGVTTNYVASYSAGTWSALNPGGGAGVNGDVWALNVLAGNLYVGGQFSATTSGTAVNNIVEWNGTGWAALTSGLTGSIYDNNIATTPDQIAVNPDPTVMALTNDGTNLYVGGDFTTAGGTAGFNNIAKWNGSAWSKLGTGMTGAGGGLGTANGDNANVYALVMYNGNLIAGGDWEFAGGTSNNFIAQWTGSSWIGFNSSCGTGISSDVFCLCVSNGSLFAGGQFPDPAFYAAQYTGAGPSMSVGAAPSATICQGDNTVLTASGATSYTWSPASSLNKSTGAIVTATPTVTTTYTIQGTTGGCSGTQTVVVTVNPSPTMTVTNSNPNLCSGVGTSTLTVTSGNGTGYTWGPAVSLNATTGTSVIATPTATTIYTVTATGADGCTNSQTLTVNVTALPTVTVSTSSATICAGTGTNITAGGATTYSWGPASGLNCTTCTTVNADPGSATTYTVTGTTLGCSGTATVSVAVNPTPTINASASAPSICPSGTTTVTATGAGVGGTYTWSPAGSLSSSTGSSVTSTPGGTTTYTVTGTDGNGCQGTATVVVTVNPSPTITVTPPSANLCAGVSTTTLTASGAGGGGSYTWSPSSNLNTSTGATVISTPTTSTTYTVTGTNASGCSATKTVVVSVNPTPTINVNATSPTICNGNSTSILATGATTYTWSPGTGLNVTTGGAVNADPGSTQTYTVTGTQAGCPGTGTVVLTVNPTPTILASATPPSVCPGNSSTLNVSGGVTYAWSPATGLNSTTGATVTSTPVGTTTYTVTETDINGCNNTATVSVTVNPTPTITVTPPNPTICPGANAPMTASGAGVGGTYSWSPATGLSATTGATVTGAPVSSTTYTVTGTSASGCVGTQTVSISVVSTLTISLSAAPPAVCPGSSTVITALGATTYSWSPSIGLSSTTGSPVTSTPLTSTTYTVIGSSGGCTAKDSIIININPTPTVTVNATGIAAAICAGDTMGLIAGGALTYTWSPGAGLNATTGSYVIASPGSTATYTVTGTDGNGCTNTATAVIAVYPTPTINISSSTPAICSGDSVTLNATGGTTYSWLPPIGLSCTVCPNPTSTTTTTVTYTVTGKGTGGCKAKDSITITINPTPTITVAKDSVRICSGGSVIISASGASSYTWSPPGGLSCTSCDSTTANPGSTTIYTVTGTNAGGCTSKDSVTVTIDKPVVIPTASSPTVCAGSSTILSATGAANYTWSPPGGLSCTSCNNTTANPGSTTSYTVIGTDTIGCSDTTTLTVTVNPTPTVNVSANDTTICSGSSALLTASGASNYLWSPPGGLSCTSCNNTTANPGSTTTYTVVGSNGTCKDTTTFTVIVNTTPTVSIGVSHDTICSGSSATLTANGTAGSYVWSTGATTSTISVSPGSQTGYTVTAGNGTCTTTATTTVNLYPPLTVTMINDSECLGKTGTVGVIVSGGEPSYSYSWSSNITGSGPGPFSVTPTAPPSWYVCSVSDLCGTTRKDSSEVVIRPSPQVSFTTTPDTVPGGQYVVFVNTSTNASSFYWSFGDGNSSNDTSTYHVYGPPGSYVVYLVGTNASGCIDTAWDTVYVIQGLIVPNVFTPNGDGQNDVFHVTAGGMQTYSIEIFNRWGQKVFLSDNPNIDWDGRSMSGIEESTGPYYYLINATDYSNKTYKLHGYLELIR